METPINPGHPAHDDVAERPAPNHHAGQGGDHFRGLVGVLAGLTMTFRRRADSDLAIRLTGTSAGDGVVDVGCGPGSAVRRAAGRGAQVVGVDPAPMMRRLAGLIGLGRHRADVSYVDGVAERLPLADASASVLWTIASVHHWPDVEGGIAEARRVLRPGGRFLAMERQRRADATGMASHGWTKDQADSFAALCRDAGFVDVRIEQHTVGPRSVHAVLATNAGSPRTGG